MCEPARIIDSFYTIDGQDLTPLAKSGYAGWLTNFILDARIIALRQSAQGHIHLFTCDLATLISGAKEPSTLHSDNGLAVFTRNPQYKIVRVPPLGIEPQTTHSDSRQPKNPPPPPPDLKAKSMWVFPIHRVNHWLFGAVDFAGSRLLFMDPFGIVDQQSSTWAFTVGSKLCFLNIRLIHRLSCWPVLSTTSDFPWS